MGIKHQDLTGRGAVHPFAFVQDTDPTLNPDNHVTAFKAWIDTSSSNALKIRNAGNTAWLTAIAGAAQASVSFVARSYIQKIAEELPQSDLLSSNFDFHQITYV